MILVTGATGFVGRRLLTGLDEVDMAARILLRPAHHSPRLPKGLRLDVALASLSDPRGLRAAMKGVNTVVHLASAERHGHRGDLQAADVAGTEFLAQAARETGIDRILYLSHLGASPSSAFPLLRAKARAEEHLRRSGVSHIILRVGPLFGAGDRFTTALAKLIRALPFVLPLPGDGSTLLHPLSIDDLVTCIQWLLQDPASEGGTYSIGGPEHLRLRQVVDLVAAASGTARRYLSLRPAYVRGFTWLAERALPNPPITTHTVDYLAMSRTAPLDSLVRLVGLQPRRLAENLGHLQGRRWGLELLRSQLGAAGSD